MAFEVEIAKFEGPLDLMLHLIHQQKLDIFDLDMLVLADQYIAYLKSQEDLHLEIESEYLVELASLIEYKSKKLLPSNKDEIDDEYDDSKEKLVARLLEYQKYKEAAKSLNEAYLERSNQYAKPMNYESSQNDDLQSQKIEGDPYDLLKAMNRVLRRVQLSKPLDIKYTQKELSPEERILQIKARMIDLPRTFDFSILVEDCKDLKEYVVTFIAILDMAKNHFISFKVDENENILFSKGKDYE